MFVYNIADLGVEETSAVFLRLEWIVANAFFQISCLEMSYLEQLLHSMLIHLLAYLSFSNSYN